MTPNSTKGTASYFPSIEAKYGRPVADWKKLIRDRRNEAYGVGHMVELEHGMRHEHANALAAVTLHEVPKSID